MVNARQVFFPEGTVFLRLDGVLFASLANGDWYAVDHCGSLVPLEPQYAAEVSRMFGQGELIDEQQFRAELAADTARSGRQASG